MTSLELEQRSGQNTVAALVVTYFPDANFPQRLERLLGQVDRLVVVDNGSDQKSLAWKEACTNHSGVTVLENGRNLGIASALNRGMCLLANEGMEWVLTMDQDSTIEDGFIGALLETVGEASNPAKIALVGCDRRDSGANFTGHRWLRPKKGPPFFERVPCEKIGPEGVTLVITSGTLTSVAAYNHLGPFEDGLFIDMVDTEYCLRARRAGYRTLISCRARMIHRVGSKRQARLVAVTLSPMHHDPLRKYYIFRNAVHVIRVYGRACPHWLIYQVLALLEVVTGIVVFEDRKGLKLKACAAGLWDGLLGRKGPAARTF